MIVLGDLNEAPLAATTQILLGPPGSELEPAGFDRDDQADGMRLWNLAPRLAALHPDRAVTRRFRGRGITA